MTRSVLTGTIICLCISLLFFSTVCSGLPSANFTSNVTTGSIYPLVVQFNDTSNITLDTPTWNWSFGDGRYNNSRNATYKYAVAGKYTVSLTVTNSSGTNTTTKIDYINLTSDSDDYLISWLHMNGTHGSNNFNGEKGVNWIPSGAAQLCNMTKYFGSASGNFTGSKPYIYTPSTSLFDFGTGDFTIEMWVNVSSTGNAYPIIIRANNVLSNGWGIYHTTSSTSSDAWAFYMGSYLTNSTGTFVIPPGVWNHLVITRESGTVKIYLNGTLLTTKTGMGYNFDTANPVYISYNNNKYFNGYIDEFRISNGIARWKDNFTTPYAEYRGVLETSYPDINSNSTLRYKTDPWNNAYIGNATSGGTRNRTLQIENVINTSRITGKLAYDPLYTMPISVRLNETIYTGMSLDHWNIDSLNGTIGFNVSRAAGFNNGTIRTSFIDIEYLYYNYTDQQFTLTSFSHAFLHNGSTGHIYPIHNFIVTNMTILPWNFTANFTSNTTTQQTGEPVIFNSSFIGSYPNRWNWSWGDGTHTNGTESNTTHTWSSPGLYEVRLTEYLWQNTSVSSTFVYDYINITGSVIPTPTPTPTPTATPGGNTTTSTYNGTYTYEDTFIPFWLWATMIFAGVVFIIIGFFGNKIIFGLLSMICFAASAFASPMVGFFNNEVVEVNASTYYIYPVVHQVTQPWVMWLLWGFATIAFFELVLGIIEIIKELNEVNAENWL
jgi:PKD repeat protein